MRFRRAACALAVVLSCSPFDSAVVASDAGAFDGALDAGAPDAPSTPAGDATAAVEPAASCKALLEREPARRNEDGIYDLDPDGPGGAEPFPAYCDMTLDGGGWTLVGRSAPPDSMSDRQPFGWRFDTGSVSDTTRPYSMDVATKRLEFTEVLVSDRDRTVAYKFGVPQRFIETAAAISVQTEAVTRVAGNCDPVHGEPTMLRHAGATTFPDVFYLRDVQQVDQHTGLKANGFQLEYNNCDQGGLLHGRQGMILVR